MPKHSRHRCPACDCLNPTEEWSVDQGGTLYCEHCPQGPCAYDLLFECRYWTKSGEQFTNAVTRVRRDCPSACTYSSLWWFNPNDSDALSFWRGGCAWNTDVRAVETFFRKWQLTITSPTTATIVGTARDGATATYVTDEWQCEGRVNFRRTAMQGVAGLPEHLCVAPFNNAFVNPNDEDCTDACLGPCYDGDPAGSEVFTITNTVTGCGDTIITPGEYTFDRGGTLPCGVSGGPQGCLYFWKTFSYTPSITCDQWPGQVGVLITCSRLTQDCRVADTHDAQWNVTSYCYDADLECWVLQGTQCNSYEYINPSFVITVPDVDCCCEGGCEKDCPGFDTDNPTLNVSFAAPGCGTIDGCIQEISNGGSGYTWDATSTTCFSTVTLSKDGTDCWKLTLGAAECISATYDAVSVTCDPPEIVFEFTFTPDGTGCCGGATTSVTATVTL